MIGKRKIVFGIVLYLVFLTSVGVGAVMAIDLPPLSELNGIDSTISALSGQKSGEFLNSKMDSGINRIVSDYKKSKSGAIKAMSSSSQTVEKEKLIIVKTPEIVNGRIKVYLDLKDKEDVKELQAKYDLSGEITTDFSETAQVNVPVENLEDLAEEDSVECIREPVKAATNSEPSMKDITSPITSEGVSLIQADKLHKEGIKGDGIKVAIIDQGFAMYKSCPEINNIVETKSFAGNNDMNGDEDTHGTAVAEIISDCAPNARLFLYDIETSLEFVEAINRAISQDVDVISSSLGFFCANPETFKIIEKAKEKGIVTVLGAGNHANKHFNGIIPDSDGDGWLEFSRTPDGKIDETIDLGWITVESGKEKIFSIFLDWGEWPETEKNYDLYLLSEGIDGFRVVASSKANNIGNTPIEFLIVTVTGPSTFKLHIAILQVKGQNAEIEIYTSNIDLQEHRIPYGSIPLPGCIDEGITVGAIDCATKEIESYSSQGSELDFVGPTRVSTWSYRSFGGTSAAIPHIAGIVTLLKSAFPEMANEQILQVMQQTTLDLGPGGKDEMYGYGLPQVFDAYKYLCPPETPENATINETVNSSEAVIINQS